jgi:predicted phosphoribosyltransferase
MRTFANRSEAGRLLAERLAGYAGRPDVVVLALPRGGVPLGFEVARALEAPLDVFVVRKVGLPGQEELAVGAIATGGAVVLNRDVVRLVELGPERLDELVARARPELERRERAFRGERAAPELTGRTAILVDDGLATGATMRAAVAAVRQQAPARIVVAVPVAPPATCAALSAEVDELVCLQTPEPFFAVGAWYGEFGATTDDEVRELLARSARSSD